MKARDLGLFAVLVMSVGVACAAITYDAKLRACIDDAHTLAASQECRCNVNKAEVPPRPCTPDVTDAGDQ